MTAIPVPAGFEKRLGELLVELCAVDTTPRAELRALAQAELTALGIVERVLRSQNWPGIEIIRSPISSGIESHPFYSRPYYTASADGSVPGAAETYAGRWNLVVRIPGSNPEPGRRLALNAHVDVVKPYVPPRFEDGVVYGRGACDDKGPLVGILGALELLKQQLAGRPSASDLVLMFVIEEEMGGNGSLSLAIDRELRKQFDSLVVSECTSGSIHPGNRGAVWYKLEAQLAGANLFEASAFVVDELEAEGRAIRSESRHELFPQRPVQTCHGVIGGYGEHPSRICGRTDFQIQLSGNATGVCHLITDILESALAEYVGLYGDKTKAIDPATNRPKVDHHYDLRQTEHGFAVAVHGSTGHMGSTLQNDGAITKMATMVRALIRSKAAVERQSGGSMQLALAGWSDSTRLVMEGGQGFLPTHTMDDVMQRLRSAALRGLGRYLMLVGRSIDPVQIVRVTFDKLHNAAFAGRTDTRVLQDAMAVGCEMGMRRSDDPIRGWEVSCDARIFACEYPGLPVLTIGPGHLVHAHADNEQMATGELSQFAQFLARFILRHSGTISE